ncbi:hypothetical protein H0H87_002537 [Tephrocybe sp. NHM501043]|nr:hypothetical protein H0H87_002537 [Tephrocybe sp. NHM501043]
MASTRPASASTRPPVSPLPRQVNTQTTVLDTTHGRILCIADIRGRLSALNDLAREANAKAIIHTGDFGFFEASSLEGTIINDRTLRHLTMYSPLIPSAQRTHLLSPENPPSLIRSTLSISLLSEFPLLLSGQLKLSVPVYTVWGACEDVRVLEKFRLGTYNVDNLHVIDEATTRLLDVGGVKLRLLGLGGAVVGHKMFDCGDGRATIAGGQGTMWTTALQIGELVDTAQRVFDPSETRVLLSHASPGREGLIAQLALAVKADLTVSAGLHFRYATSYNEFSVQGDYEGFRQKLVAGKAAFDRVWEGVRPQVEAVMDEGQKVLMDKALSVVERVPPELQQGGQGEEPAWKNCWNWNLCDAAYGTLVLDVREGRVSAELKSQGFNYAYRRTPTTQGPPQSAHQQQGTPHAAANASLPPPTSKAPTPAPPSVPATNGSPAPIATPEKAEKAEREKAKKKEKRERKEREKAEKTEKDKTTQEGTPRSTATPTLPESTSAASTSTPAPDSTTPADTENANPKSPTTAKGPKQRNPWTIFMRIPSSAAAGVSEKDIRGLFPAEVEKDIVKVHMPVLYPGRARVVYVEFGDEEAMKRGLGACANKLNDTPIETKQATDRESRAPPSGSGSGQSPNPGGHGTIRGRGRGGGGYAARGFAAAGLTRGGGHGFKGGHHGSGGGSGGGSAGGNGGEGAAATGES